MGDEEWELSPKGVETIKEIGRLFRDTTLTLDQIAVEVGLANGEAVRLLWTLADNNGVLDGLGL